ncbi:MAG: ATP-dependent helicase, partial [Alistipes sp.]|nr:ATP-dependent helicase [Alistipes sp.]
SMLLFKEQRDAEIRGGERQPDEEATIEEWLQNVMLMTDMDKDDPEDRNKVTLMTVHSAKGLEYKHVYIVGLEENLFPSQRAMETPDGLEEERRLFYVALTRAKVAATLSYAEMRFKWGEMNFSHPSCFLHEIDPQYLETAADPDDERPLRREEGGSAIDELRRRFDYRFQQKQTGREDEHGYGSGPAHRYPHTAQPARPQGGKYGATAGRYATAANSRSNGGTRFGTSGSGGGRFGSSGPDAPQKNARFEAPKPRTAPDPALVQTPRPSTEGMRRLGVRQAAGGAAAGGMTTCGATTGGGYAIGQRVEHQKFGVGIIRRIEMLAEDQKLVIAFDNAGEKTLLAKFAKLTKL